MKYLLMTIFVAALLAVPACNRRDHKDDPTYYSEDQQVPPSSATVTYNPTVLADQARIAMQFAAAKAVVTTKPASQPAPAAPTGPAGGSFMGIGTETKPEAPAPKSETPATEPAKETPKEPATEPAMDSGKTEAPAPDAPADSGSPPAP